MTQSQEPENSPDTQEMCSESEEAAQDMTPAPSENAPDAQGPCPESSESPESEESAPVFTPVLSDPLPESAGRKPLILLGVAIVAIIIGVIFCGGDPDTAKAKPAPLDVANMTAEELAKNASPPAARELARRIAEGTGEEQSAAAAAMRNSPSPRLARNMAMAMALQQQKRQMEQMRQMHGFDGMTGGEVYQSRYGPRRTRRAHSARR